MTMVQYPDYGEAYQQALNLLVPLWKGIPGEYKQKYARNIWDQFSDNLRAAAYTSSLSLFVSHLCSRMQIAIRDYDAAALNAALGAGNDRVVLRQLRDETASLTLMVRLENDKEREAWKNREKK